MHRGARFLLLTIGNIAFALALWPWVVAAADDAAPQEKASPLASALFLAEESSIGLALFPELLEVDSTESTDPEVAQVAAEQRTLNDPRQFTIDESKLVPPITTSANESPPWESSFDAVTGFRLDEDFRVLDTELDTGTNVGARARVSHRFAAPDQIPNSWEIIGMGLFGRSEVDEVLPQWFHTVNHYAYEATLLSVEGNLIVRAEHRNRVRRQFVGLRYVQLDDSIDLLPSGFTLLPAQKNEATNQMVGFQAGLEQSWSKWKHLRMGYGVKAGLFYNRAERTGDSYVGTFSQFPALLLDYYADVGYRIFSRGYLGAGLYGMRIGDQYQARWAWQSPEETDTLRILGMRFGFNYNR